jgi:hypothetical protein
MTLTEFKALVEAQGVIMWPIYVCIRFTYLLAIYNIGSHLRAMGEKYPEKGYGQ